MRLAKYYILFIMTVSAVFCFAQKGNIALPSKLGRGGIIVDNDALKYNPYHLLNDSIIILTLGGACKNRKSIYTKLDDVKLYPQNEIGAQHKEDLLTIHGNVLYNFNYRSYIDTPFQQNGMVQHTIQTFMNGDIAGKYPFRAVFTYRASNSPYFSNTSDVSVQYRQSDMVEKIKSDLRKDADSSVDKSLFINPSDKYVLQHSGKPDSLLNINPFTKELHKEYDSLYAQYAQKRKELEKLQLSNQNPLQAIVEAREANLNKQSTISSAESSADSLASKKWVWPADGEAGNEHKGALRSYSTDSMAHLPTDNERVDSGETKIKKTQYSIIVLKKEVENDEQKILLFQKKVADSILLIKRHINQLNSPESVNEYMNSNDTTERNRLSTMQKLLLSVNQLGIGRSWINYSPLTVSDVSLNGFNIEMNPGNLYVAVAAGSINSQFRDFILNNNIAINQSVKLLRLGIGKKNGNNFIVTMYSGRKALLNTSGINDSVATQPIVGTTISSTKVIDKNTTVTVEYARSSYENAYDSSGFNKGLLSRALNFKMNSNEAWALNFKSIYPLTNTKIDGSYRKMGEAFQSFTIYATNVKQDAYLFHANQLLWKKKLSVDVGVRKNDFNSPLTAPGYSNTTVFKSAQVSLAIPGYPLVSLGYYPSSQLFIGSNNVAYQSWYNTFNAVMSYAYKYLGLNMSTNAVYTRFYNNQSDSSFSYFNASSFNLTHSVYVSPFTFQGNLTVTDQTAIHLITVEPLVTYQYKNILMLSASVKWSRLNSIQTLWGGTAGISLLIKNVGTIQLHYDKVHLPAYNGNLIPVDMGRITFNKVF
jgi:hypothetical protein